MTSPTPAEAARTVIRAVNARDAALYASVFAEDAVVKIYGGDVRLTGRGAIEDNRGRHFTLHPGIRSEIQHLAEIGNVAILHDRVWLQPGAEPMEVIEIFTCKDGGFVAVMEVIQSAARSR